MPPTAIDPKVALVVIDLQRGIATGNREPVPVEVVIARAVALADAFRARKLPVVLVNVDGAPSGRTEARRTGFDPPPEFVEIVPELGPKIGDLLITKRTWGAFQGTTLDADLRDLGVTQIVLAGVSTSAGVESTARAAHERGYNVTLAIDAMTDSDGEEHLNSVGRIFPRLGETGTTDEILELLEQTR